MGFNSLSFPAVINKLKNLRVICRLVFRKISFPHPPRREGESGNVVYPFSIVFLLHRKWYSFFDWLCRSQPNKNAGFPMNRLAQTRQYNPINIFEVNQDDY